MAVMTETELQTSLEERIIEILLNLIWTSKLWNLRRGNLSFGKNIIIIVNVQCTCLPAGDTLAHPS